VIHTTLDGLIARVLDEDSKKYDLLADTRRMSVSSELTVNDTEDVILTIDQDGDIEELQLSEHALSQMSADLGIPKRYFDRMKVEAFDLFKSNAHHWLYN